MSEFFRVAKASEISAGMARGFVVNGKGVMVANVGGKYYAVEDRCTHAGAKLSTGILAGSIITCMAHGAQFDVTSGAPLTTLAKGPIKTYEVRLSGEDIEIRI